MATRTRMKGSLRRQTILLAATEAFIEGGTEAVSMERVASKVGVSRAVLYDHFPSRSALLAAIHDEYARFVNEKVASAVFGHDDTLEDLAAASVRGFFDAVSERGVFNRMLIRAAAADPEMVASQQRMREHGIESSAKRLAQLLGVQVDDIRPAVAIVLSMLEQAATLWLNGDCTREEAEELYVRMAVAALKASSQGAAH